MAEEKNILIVDDSRTVRHLLKMILSRGIRGRITEAEDGVQAVDALNSGTFHLVITDINMPNMDGLSLIRKARNEMGLKVPIVVITTKGKVSDRDKGISLGADAYLTKPFKAPEVLKTAAEMLA